MKRQLLFAAVSTAMIISLYPIRAAGATRYNEAVRADWLAQERRLGRTADSVDAVRDVWWRGQDLLARRRQMSAGEDLEDAAARLEGLKQDVEKARSMEAEARLDLYFKIRSITRSLALSNPLFASKSLVFMKRHRFICQMLHEYLGYYCDYGDISGGGVYVLQEPGRSFEIRDLIDGRLPRGNYTTLALSYDGETIYFAFAERARKKPDYHSAERRCFHIFAMDADGSNLRQLTQGPEDDFDPCPLPGGDIAFMSTRRGGFARCNNPWEPIPTYTLHRCGPAGEAVRTLSFHETCEWHPSVLADGRIAYIRWDYVDRSAANYHGIWLSNPDGTNPAILWGNYTQRINACFQPHAIPGSNKVAFIAGAHHADVGGSLVVVDPTKVTLDPDSGEDDFGAIEVLTPEVCFPEAPGWPKSYFHSPWPLSEDFYLISFSFDPLPGMGSRVNEDTKTGLYYFDRFGNLELLYRDEAISSMYPLPLAARPVPPVIPPTTDPTMGDEGEFVLADVMRSHFPMPADRPITQLRIFQILPKIGNHIANQPRIGHANAENARMLLGTVPVEADGSAYFRVPARKLIYFQAVDAAGRAVQTMRSGTYLQPGERRSCVGCHERRSETVENTANLLALKRAASAIEPGPDGTLPYNFQRLVQPVLVHNCLACHDGKEGSGKSAINLSDEPVGEFTQAYRNLRPYLRWYEWGGASITEIGTRPGRQGADESPLLKIIADETHAPHIRLSDEDRMRLIVWLDGNVPFYGTYDEQEQVAQKEGRLIDPPPIQ